MPPTSRRSQLVHCLLPGLAAVGFGVAGFIWSQEPWSWALLGAAVVAIHLAIMCVMRPLPRVAYFGTLMTIAAAMAVGGLLAGEIVVSAIGGGALLVIAAVIPLATVRANPPISTSAQSVDGALLESILEHTMLSDAAKRVLFREREVQLLRDALEHEVAQGKYNVALTICNEMAALFGHREEAEAFRARIIEAHHARYETAAHQAVEQIESLLAARDWLEAHRAIARAKRLYPESPHVSELDARLNEARGAHKAELEQAFIEATEREDVEGAMELLRELDRSLGREEAARLREAAAGVVARHRDNLGTQFKLAVSDHQWAEAARAGDDIMREFPNSKMAEEVRSMIDVLRTRATQAAVEEEC